MNEHERIDPDRAVEMVSEIVNQVVKNCNVSIGYEYTHIVTDFGIKVELSHGGYHRMFEVGEYQLRFYGWREFVTARAYQCATNLGRAMFLAEGNE